MPRGQDIELPPGHLAREIANGLIAEFAGQIQGVIGHGSWVHDDFCVGRSDLDLVVVLDTEPEPEFIVRTQAVLAGITDANPEWRDRLELGLVTRQTIQCVLDGDQVTRRVGRISPGEPLHLVTADRNRLLDWEAAHHGKSVYGAAPTEMIPAIPAIQVREVVLEHLHHWPIWIAESTSMGYQAYATLTVSRAAAYLSTGTRLTKRQGAAWAATRFPAWQSLIQWAVTWWYSEGTENDHPPGSVQRFVDELATLW